MNTTVTPADIQIITMHLLQILNLLPPASRQLIRKALETGKATRRVAPRVAP